jgi:multidrug efflux system membrane fusion protein
MRKLILPLAIALAIGGGLYYRSAVDSGKSAKPAVKGGQPVPVKVAKVQVRDMPEWLDVVGRGMASESVTLKSRIDGQVAAVSFNEGQHVRKGDILLRLDPADLAAKLRQVEANLARSQAQMTKARADVGRYEALRQSGFVSEEKLSDLRASLQAAEAAVQADVAAADHARLQLSYTTLRAPIDGIVGSRLVFPGSSVKLNETALALINRIQPLHIAFAVPEKHLPRLRAALAAGKFTAQIAIGDTPVTEAAVNFIDNTVDVGTGTIQMKANTPNAKEQLAPGQFLNVRLTLGYWKNAAIVPAEAIQQGPQGVYVFVVKPDKGIEQRKVTLADSRDGTAIVTQGLNDGETVVTDGHLRLTLKSKVSIKEPGKAGAKADTKAQ